MQLKSHHTYHCGNSLLSGKRIRENVVGWKDSSQLNSAQNLRAAVAAAMLRLLQDGLGPSVCGAAGSPTFASEKQHAINLC